MAEIRKRHPYHTHDAILAQPALIENVLSNRTEIERVAAEIAKKDRINFVGIGTSLHAAQIAAQWMRHFTGGRFQAHFEQSFEFIHGPIALDARDVVVIITHTGTSTASIESIRRAHEAGALTVAIVGHNSGEGARVADLYVETCEQEVSFTYTKSYTTALATLAILVHRIAETRNLLAVPGVPQMLHAVPAQMRAALDSETRIQEIANDLAQFPRIDIFGAGVGWPTAREAALKIKEASYLTAEGFETEEILHGPFSEVDLRTALIGILSGSNTDDRARQILRAAGELKVTRVAVVVQSANHEVAAERVIEVSQVAPWLSALVHLVPLQLLAYFLALERGANPDTGRQEQALHNAASRHYKY